MPERPRSIDPSTMITTHIEHSDSSQPFPSRRGVSIGQTTEGLYVVQLGSVAQVENFLDNLDHPTGRRRPLTPRKVFEMQASFMPDYNIRDLEGDFAGVQVRLKHGEELIEGAYVYLTPLGQPSEVVSGRSAVWAPVKLSLATGWRLPKALSKS